MLEILRSPKFMNMSLFDWIMTFIAINIISSFLQKKYLVKDVNDVRKLDAVLLIIVLVLASVMHRYFNVNAVFLKY